MSSPLVHARRNGWRLALAGLVMSFPLLGATQRADAAAATQVNGLAAFALASSVEADRAWVRLPGLALDPALNALATQHSAQMAAANSLFHSSLTTVGAVVPGHTAVGENVGTGTDPASIAWAFVHSAPHLSNILGPYNLLGVGVVSSGGRLWVTEEFAQGHL